VRILVVDDEPKLVRAVRRGLERDGHAVDVAGDGVEALRLACASEYDAVLLDVLLPGLDGVEVCRTLRSRGRWMPILMLTARDAVPDRIRGLDAGADDYLIKPFSYQEMLARLRALLRRGSPERPTRLQVGDVTMDPAARTVSRDGQPVELSPREFALLEFLMRRPGEVVSRRRILEHVWAHEYVHDGLSNVVDVYVGYLRRKLERPFDRPFIRTARGVGYGVG
jgi:two-component system OmpR family response regulator